MPLTILSDADVKTLFQGLTQNDVMSLCAALSQALTKFSCSTERQYQPHCSVITRPGQQVTLFMPATTEQLVDVKIVGIRPSPVTASLESGEQPKPQPGLQSSLTVCDSLGRAIGILDAAELTAFRTALGSMLLYKLRQVTEHIVVFGAGKQALWHIRLAVILRGNDIRRITIVNLSKHRTLELIQTLQEAGYPSHITIEPLDRGNTSDSAMEDIIAGADVIFCTTPSTKPLFPTSFLTSEQARSKSRFISAIGSYRLDMAEIDPELLKAVTNPEGTFSSQVWRGYIAVDSADGCLQEAGELVMADLTSSQMLEVGQIHKESDKGMESWLRSGFVVYKSVGIGIMDIVIGEYLIGLARSKEIGLTSHNF
ncbi:NAD(P)-binding protein [Trichoderma evansii]